MSKKKNKNTNKKEHDSLVQQSPKSLRTNNTQGANTSQSLPQKYGKIQYNSSCYKYQNLDHFVCMVISWIFFGLTYYFWHVNGNESLNGNILTGAVFCLYFAFYFLKLVNLRSKWSMNNFLKYSIIYVILFFLWSAFLLFYDIYTDYSRWNIIDVFIANIAGLGAIGSLFIIASPWKNELFDFINDIGNNCTYLKKLCNATISLAKVLLTPQSFLTFIVMAVLIWAYIVGGLEFLFAWGIQVTFVAIPIYISIFLKNHDLTINDVFRCNIFEYIIDKISLTLYLFPTTLENNYCRVLYDVKDKSITCESKKVKEQKRKAARAKEFSGISCTRIWRKIAHDYNETIKYQQINEFLLQYAQSCKHYTIKTEGKNKPFKSNSKITIVDVNSASEDELIALPGINRIQAKKIIQFRERERYFNSREDFFETMQIKDHFQKQMKHIVVANIVAENCNNNILKNTERVVDL